MRNRRDAHVLAVAQSFGEIALELAAIVGLPDQITQRDAVAIQVLLDAGSEHGAGRRAPFLGESPEQQAAANFRAVYWISGKRRRWACRP